MPRSPVTIFPLLHCGARRIKVECPSDPAVISRIKKMEGSVKAGVNAGATLHTLRHSYATYCMKQGQSLKHVQKTPGHNSIKTTEIYVHLACDALRKLKSPIDNLKLT